ncbi:MAG: adenylosuccinate synthetase [Clostridia bacterium]|nr:adenylosuccinate synthetase [Clostridia bacterium]
MDSYVLCGMQFGDEGKGTFVDYMSHREDADAVVRYNGGSQASHTVVTPSGTLHKFSQLGSGMFLENCHTYITENTVVNLDNLMVELKVFSEKTGISVSELINRIHIHENCFVVTPYHKLLNKLRELSLGENRRGTVGTGVSEVRYVLEESQNFPLEPSLGVQVKDIFDSRGIRPLLAGFMGLHEYVSAFYQENQEVIWKNTPEEMKEGLQKEIDSLLSGQVFNLTNIYRRYFNTVPREFNLKRCIYSTYEQSLHANCKKVIFEGSQGLLIDGKYGIKPNTTFLDTTNQFALRISRYTDHVTKVGIVKAFSSRHGPGIFPTESEEVSSKIQDPNQEESFWNGKIRFGWLDVVLLRYAQHINQVDELYLSSLDLLDDFEELKICVGYIYDGKVDEEFNRTFEYVDMLDGRKYIDDIVMPSDRLGEYLKLCVPDYMCIRGWKKDISQVTDQEELPVRCRNYIGWLGRLMNLPVTVVSVGPTRENKIRMDS